MLLGATEGGGIKANSSVLLLYILNLWNQPQEQELGHVEAVHATVKEMLGEKSKWRQQSYPHRGVNLCDVCWL